VLDDVLSELDAQRGDALLRLLPAGQVVMTTAGAIPAAATPDRVIRIANGAIIEP
jgi:recombinational DNA repair ATPase RecF